MPMKQNRTHSQTSRKPARVRKGFLKKNPVKESTPLQGDEDEALSIDAGHSVVRNRERGTDHGEIETDFGQRGTTRDAVTPR